jgi:GTPase involved in cell partitioning and DNA repair
LEIYRKLDKTNPISSLEIPDNEVKQVRSALKLSNAVLALIVANKSYSENSTKLLQFHMENKKERKVRTARVGLPYDTSDRELATAIMALSKNAEVMFTEKAGSDPKIGKVVSVNVIVRVVDSETGKSKNHPFRNVSPSL